jgi:cephalosporin hydroxylase
MSDMALRPKSTFAPWKRLVLFGIGCLLAIMCFLAFTKAWLIRPGMVVHDFHQLFYNTAERTWDTTRWFGVSIQKNPLDLMIFQEIIYEVKPDVIVEAGTAFGGSAMFMAQMLDLLGKGKLVTIDIEAQPNRPAHPRIQYLLGSSTAPEIVEQVKSVIKPGDKVMVVLDSDHRKDHVLKELLIYSKLVTKGSYLIVEDTNVNGHPVQSNFGPGPMEALEEYMKDHSDLEIDKNRERLLITFNPNGYLRKVKDSAN